MLTRAIEARAKTHTVKTISDEGTVVDGIPQKTVTESVAVLFLVPIGMRELQSRPEGGFTSQDKKAYEVGSPTLKENEIIVDNGVEYTIREVVYRPEGGFTMYMAKKERTQ
jgi:hypothetical protein